MPPRPSIERLEQQIEVAKERLTRLRFREFGGEQPKALIHCLEQAIWLAEGCALLAGASLVAPLYVVARVLIETMLRTHWVTLSEDNARLYTEGAVRTLAKLGLILFKAGRAGVEDKTTGEDRTQEAIRRLEEIDTSQPSVRSMAQASGLEKVYDVAYRVFSMPVHGNTFGLPSAMKPDEQTTMAVEGAISLVQAILLVIDNRLLHERTTPPEEVFRVLRLAGVAGP